MSNKVWFITGAFRGFGRIWAEGALARGDTRQMPQAYPPQRGIGKRAIKGNAWTASLAVVMTGALPP